MLMFSVDSFRVYLTSKPPLDYLLTSKDSKGSIKVIENFNLKSMMFIFTQ